MKSRGIKLRILGMAIATIVAPLTLVVVPVYEDRGFICDYDASRMGYQLWLGRIKAHVWSATSPVEDFMRQKHPDALKHHWTSYEGTGRNIYGQVLYWAPSKPGPVIQLPVDMLNACFPRLSDQSKTRFYNKLCDPAADVTVLMKALAPELGAMQATNAPP